MAKLACRAFVESAECYRFCVFILPSLMLRLTLMVCEVAMGRNGAR